MGEITFKTGQVTTSEKVKNYFEYLLRIDESVEPFPVDFDIVWPIAYTTKSNAKRALTESGEFFEGIDYEITESEEVVKRPQGGTFQRERIQLSVQCLEFFIARKIRPIFEIYRQCRIKMTQEARAKARIPYHLRRYLANHDQVPFGYFSVLQEITTKLIAPMEVSGYTLPDKMVPDISVGKVWCNFLRGEKGIDPDDFDTYDHSYEDGRVVKAKLYPIDLLPTFLELFQNDWIGTRAEKYFRDRDETALPHIPKKVEAARRKELGEDTPPEPPK